MSKLSVAVVLVLVSILDLDASAQQTEFDPENFILELNEHLESHSGVTVSGKVLPDSSMTLLDQDWAEHIARNPQSFGILALDEDKHVVDIFGAETPYTLAGEEITVPGYDLPAGGEFRIVGSAGLVNAAAGLAMAQEVQAPSNDIEKAVETIANATDYIANRLCGQRYRPTKLVLHLTAGFNLVFSGETGSQVEWDLEIVCERFSP